MKGWGSFRNIHMVYRYEKMNSCYPYLMTKEKHDANVAKANEIMSLFHDNKLDYDLAVKRLETINNAYLKEFKKELADAGLSPKTIEAHVSNADFFVNVYLPHPMDATLYDGGSHFRDFFGYFYIYKCMFASVSDMKQQITSLKKFYAFMFQHLYISPEQYATVITTIKDCKDMWLEEMKEYDRKIFGDF